MSGQAEKAVILLMAEQTRSRILEQENAKLEARIAELEELLLGPSERHIYPRDHPRDSDGRPLGVCKLCHSENVALYGRGLCRRCYDRLYRVTHLRRRQPGGLVARVAPLDQKKGDQVNERRV